MQSATSSAARHVAAFRDRKADHPLACNESALEGPGSDAEPPRRGEETPSGSVQRDGEQLEVNRVLVEG